MFIDRRRWCWRLILLLLLALVATGACPAAGPAAELGPTLSRATLPANGRQETTLTVSKFGRYAVTVDSSQGTALQLLDRIAGPGEIHGKPGRTDGRLDVFLDRGVHKIIAYSDEKGSGNAQLKVHRFAERSAPPPLLVELKPVNGSLGDFEQVSYWVEVKERRQVIFEAAGRNLVDLRLWTNGDWLVDAAPSMEVVMPQEGHPLLVCRLTAALDPGVYLLTAYGGVSQPWTEDSPEHPFHLRFGIPKLSEVGRSRHTVSPFGTDRWLVPRSATYFRVELPEAQPAALTVRTFNEQQPFVTSGSTAQIEKTSLVPVAELEYFDRSAERLVTVAGAAGQPYVLQHFDVGEPYVNGGRFWPLGDEGKYWVSTVHSGDPTDSVDATALIVRVPRGRVESPRTEAFAAQLVELAPHSSWARRCNLLDSLTVFLHVQQSGKYEILARGVEARFRIEPFLTYRPQKYEPPAMKGANSVWDLDAGYYVLTAEPVKRGIIDIAVHPTGTSGITDVLSKLIGKNRSAELQALRAAAQFPELVIDHDYRYTIFINQQPEVKVGMVLRRLPLDLADPLPVIQMPGETVAVPFTVNEPSTLRAEAEDGALLPVSVDAAAPQQSQRVAKGEHRLEVHYAGDQPVHYALMVEPLRLQASAPLPPLPNSAEAKPPKFTVLTEKAPRFFDLDRNADATFLVRADAPALYELQSTGLLSTEGNLRTRTITSFARAAENGTGGNFFIEQYLREGDYQVTVSTRGLSKGHLGVTLQHTQLIDGGVLTPSVPAHIALPAGEAVAYHFTIADAGEYRLRSIGVGTTFTCRLEDADGWPIEPPNIAADLSRRFGPGTYQFISMPQPVAARRLTLLERIQEPPKLEGHGPHRLPLATRLEHVWLEPAAAGTERVPDVWEFTLPAPVDARIELTSEMQGVLVLVEDDGRLTPVATLPPARGWKGKLQAGHYRLEATCVRPNNQLPYAVAVWPEQLVAGLDREISAPASIPVSVGRDALVQLSSFGAADVRARLYDDQGQLIASNDDSPDDWNFQIQARVGAGMYRLQVDPVGIAPAKMLVPPPPSPPQPDYYGNYGAQPTPVPTPLSATCSVSMRAPEETEQAPLALPAKTDVSLGQAVVVYPLSLAEKAGLLLVAAHSAEGVGLAVEAAVLEGGSARWRTVAATAGRAASLDIPLRPAERYRLRLWSADGRATAAQLSAVTFSPRPVTEHELQAGVRFAPVPGFDPRRGVVAIHLDRPGVFQLKGEAGATRACSSTDAACEVAPNDLVTASESLLWLVANLDSASASQRVSATRALLKPRSDGLQFDVAAGRPVVCDVAHESGPLLTLVTSRAGQPGIRIVDQSETATAGPEGSRMAVGAWSAAAVALDPQEPAAVVWSAAARGEPLAVRLRQLSFAPPPHEQAPWGSWDATVTGVTARSYDLPPGAKRVRLSLQAATVAVLSAGEHVRSVHWYSDEPFEETVEDTADRLTLLHMRSAADQVHVDVLPIAPADVVPPLALGAPYERAELRAGLRRIAVAGGQDEARRPGTLHVRIADPDAQAEPVLIGADGRVARGRDLPVGAGGTLLVPHGPGLVMAWVDRRGEEAHDLWGQAPLPAETKLGPPTVVRLSGAVQALQFHAPQPLMLHVRSSTPVVTLLKRGDAAPEVAVHSTGTLLDAYLTEEPALLCLRAIGGGTLWGTAEVTVSPVTPIGEGLGPEVLLSAGGTSLFSFTVTREGPVGIGVRANPDVVDCTLLDSAGNRLGSGVVQMPTLKPGTYLLALHAPADTGPVPARPALAGVELPSTGPPEDVVRSYMNLATAPEPTPAGEEE